MTSRLRKVEPERAEGRQRPEETRGDVDAPVAPGGPEAAEPAAPTEHRDETPERPDENLDARIDKLLDAANAASGHVRNLYLFFLSFGLYLAIIFGSTTHEQLLRASPVTLPLFTVELPLVAFYWVAPALFVLLHFNLLVQCYLLAGKLKQLNLAIRASDGAQQVMERARLDPFPFTQMLLAEHLSPFARRLPKVMAWTSIVVLPVILLLFGQAMFLPYHSSATTWWHRFLVLLDLGLLWLLWPLSIDLSGRWKQSVYHWLQLSRRPMQVANRLLTDPSSRRPQMRWPSARSWKAAVTMPWRPVRRAWRRYVTERQSWRPLLLEQLGVLALVVSLMVLVIPGEMVAWPFDRLTAERARIVVFPRNLELRETELVVSQPGAAFSEGKDETTVLKYVRGLDLRERDLRHADLGRTDLRKVDLRDADLQGADLGGADLQGADLGASDLQDANLQGAGLAAAELNLARLRYAVLQGADLQGAGLGAADLQGAVLSNANARGADLGRANLQVTYLNSADLQGADFTEANLQGAQLTLANLQSAFLLGANLQGADLSEANLAGAVLRDANLQGALLSDANLQGTDLREAQLWSAKQFPVYVLTDLRRLELTPPAQSELTQWLAEAREIADKYMRERMLAVLTGLTEARILEAMTRLKQELGLVEEDHAGWQSQFPAGLAQSEDVLFEPVPPPIFGEFDPKLASFLIGLACAPEAPTAIARSIAWRGISEPETGRFYPGLLAQALLGDACPPAKDLDEDLVRNLREVLRDHLVARAQMLKQGLAAPSP